MTTLNIYSKEQVDDLISGISINASPTDILSLINGRISGRYDPLTSSIYYVADDGTNTALAQYGTATMTILGTQYTITLIASRP